MNIAILTSSRADFGYYLPLLKGLQAEPAIRTDLIAFGTHLSKFHGHTVDEITRQGFEVAHRVPTLLLSDDPGSIASSYALTVARFADLWEQTASRYDLVFCLGDRFEMAAAVTAGLPFNLKFAHIGGGEISLGAIDNVYRDFISLASAIHFVQTAPSVKRIKNLVGTGARVVVTGSISLANMLNIPLQSRKAFQKQWSIDLRLPSILVTFHSETVAFTQNETFAESVYRALKNLATDFQLIVTMPNADTNGSFFRNNYLRLKEDMPGRIFLIENFGTASYFTAMHEASLVLGNSSSGILEAASFGRYVVNVGDRQMGRLAGPNVIHVPFHEESIQAAVREFAGKRFRGKNIYQGTDPVGTIIQSIKSLNL